MNNFSPTELYIDRNGLVEVDLKRILIIEADGLGYRSKSMKKDVGK